MTPLGGRRVAADDGELGPATGVVVTVEPLGHAPPGGVVVVVVVPPALIVASPAPRTTTEVPASSENVSADSAVRLVLPPGS